jgi:hypothetical protein
MPQFADLSSDDVESIRQYVRSRGQAIGRAEAAPADPSSQGFAVPR